MPKRDEHGWRSLGRFSWKVERRDNHGDYSTTTTLSLVRETHWTVDLGITRSWKTER